MARRWRPPRLTACDGSIRRACRSSQATPRLGPCVGEMPKIVAIGLNYRLHAQEAGCRDPDRADLLHEGAVFDLRPE